MLWPAWYIGTPDELPRPILDEIPFLNINPFAPETAKTGMTYSTANCSGEVDEFPAGSTVFWFFDYDETHYVLEGEADMTYTMAGTSHTVVKKANIKRGNFYLVPMGVRITWKVSDKGPLRLFWFTQPGVPARRHGKRTQLATEGTKS